MRALVTGSAGFIGSTLVDRLLADGWAVRGVDCFTDAYSVDVKRRNVAHLVPSDRYELVTVDLTADELGALLDDVDVVFHLAGQPGVRQSWADGFAVYADRNINATQRLLEASMDRGLQRFVYASSSSVYGNVASVPTDESHPTRPHSPYGVTKLAGELLCTAYGANFGLPTACVRYFTVYGPRQRPDMATHRMIEAALDGRAFPLFGDGRQIRDFTFVDDIVSATVAAATADVEPATVVNAAGGSSVEVLDLVRLVGEAVGEPVRIDWHDAQPGDVRRTGGSIDRTKAVLGWEPAVDLAAGVAQQVAWHRTLRS